MQSIKRLKLILSVLVFTLISLISCDSNKSEDKNSNDGKAIGFDRSKMLAHYGEHLIMPRFETFTNALNTLDDEINAFENKKTVDQLAIIRANWLKVITAYQGISAFSFGSEDKLNLGSYDLAYATFPINEVTIEKKISDNDTSLNTFQKDIRGLYAIEYLIYGKYAKVEDDILINFNDNNNARYQYLKALSNEMRNAFKINLDTWKTEYLLKFKTNDGTSSTSSTTILFNHFAQDFELLKNFKVGLPLGKRAEQTTSAPERVEALYSQKSIELIKTQFKNIVDLYEGKSSSDIPNNGFKNYLAATTNGSEVVQQTELQIKAVNNILSQLEDTPMDIMIKNDPSKLESLHTELQKLTRFFKSEISSRLGIAITIEDGDGD